MEENTYRDFADELEHLDFLDEIRRLVEDIAWALANARVNPTKHAWDDIDVFGDEPVFTSLLMDKLEQS